MRVEEFFREFCGRRGNRTTGAEDSTGSELPNEMGSDEVINKPVGTSRDEPSTPDSGEEFEPPTVLSLGRLIYERDLA